MEGFELSKAVNANNVFLVKHSGLESRIDPHQYHHERIGAIRAIKAKNKAAKLSQVVTSAKQITTEINPHDVYIGLENITSNTGEYIATGDKQSISSAGVFKKGQILFPKLRPYLNKVHLAGFDGICSTEFHIFQAKNINAEFLAIYLRSDLILNKTKHLMTGNTLPRLQTEDIEKLPVPLLSSEVQQKIIEFYGDAYYQKQQKEQQAQTLLDGIDGYLLNELGITLPQQDNRLEKRIFTVPFSEVVGKRVDPDYRLKYELLFSQNGKYEFVKLKELLIDTPQYGANEEGRERNSDEDVRYIRITDIDELGNLKNNDWKTAQNIEEQYLLKKDDILFARSGSVGRCYIHKETEQSAIFAGYLIRFKLNEQKLNSNFMFYYCNSKFYKFWVTAIERPAVQSNINAEEYKALPIPLPPIEKQNEIAAHISQIRAQAKQLQADAAQVLANAKAEIERMILGENS